MTLQAIDERVNCVHRRVPQIVGHSSPSMMGPSNRQGASMRSLRKAARKVAVFHLPCGTLSTRRSPLGAQPRRRVILVLVQVSSMKTSRLGSMSP